MKRRFISLILCLCMIFSLFAGYQTAFASEERGEYIVYLDVEKQSPGYEEAFLKKDFGKAISLADEALDYYEEELKGLYADLEVISRAELLVPSLCVRLNKSELDSIKALDYVKEVFNNDIIHESDIVRSDMKVFKDRTVMTDSIKMVNSNDLIGNDEELQSKYNGKGSVLAIIDSNMDPSHEAFRLSDGDIGRLSKLDINSFLTQGKLSVKDNTPDKKLYEKVYRSEKIPFGWNYNTNNEDLNPEKELAAHGQHVSGTVGGNSVLIDGKTWRGVAPEAQLLMMNVMKKGSTSSNIYIRAMQDAIVMGADAVNMSLGSTKGLPGQADGLVGKAINNGYNLDTNFVIAAGNEGQYQGNLNIDNPDFGTMAAPGIATNAITVASLENKTMYVPLVTYGGNKYIFQTSGDIRYKKGDYFLVDCGNGLIDAKKKINDFEGKDLTGKVALIKRGGNTFNEKVLNAQNAGAIGAIIYNNVEGDLYMSVKGNRIPAISVTLDTAETMLKDLSKPVSIDMTPQEADNPQYGELSEFTNWGLSAGGYMKPDITAPGGHIYSTQTMGNTFGDMSGTSMATPHVCGAVGVIRTRLNDMMFAGETHKAALTKTILMNSSVPHVDPVTKTTTSPRRQGAGVMNLTRASKLDFTVVDRDTKIASKFVGNVDDNITLNLTIHNYSSAPKTLTPSVQATIEARDGKKLLLRPDELFSRTYDDKVVEVPAQTSVDYEITFPIEHLEKVEPFTNGAFVEGFLHLRDQNGMEISFPFVSFKGSYDKIPSIEKPLYEFDFETEKPMYWNLKTRNHDWFKYSTHIETNYGTYKDEKGKVNNNLVIAGLKNFEEIDEKKNTADEPKPIFTPIVISPNADNYQDILSIQMVMTRTANVKASIIDKAGKSNDFKIGLKYTNISTDPDNDKNRETYVGYTAPGAIPLKDYKDGDYTLRLTAAAVKAPKESYPETYRDIKFTIDTLAPQFENSFYDEKTRTLTFDLKEEGSGIDEFKVEDADGKPMDFTKDGNKVTLVVPEGKELADVNITSMDFGRNINAVTAEMLVYKDMFGSLEVAVKQAGSEALNLEYKVYTEDGKELKNHEHLKFGKYKLVVTSYSNKFELKGESEIPFEISKENRNHKITLEFVTIPTGRITIKVASKDNLEWADFDLYAKNVKNNKEFKFVQDEGIYDKYFDADLPYGDYNFDAKFKEGKVGYTITFDEDMPFTVSGSTNYSTVTANIKRSGFYKVHVTSEGAQGVKYLAKDNKNGSIVGLDELAEGTWMIFPEKMPEGMYLEKPYEYVTLTQEKPEANITFTYEEIAGKKFKFTIKDNYDKAVYYLCDFYKWIGREGKVLDYTPGMELSPGTYYVEAEANKESFGETTITIDNQSYEQTSRTFRSSTDPVEIVFNWKKYSETDKMSEGAISVNDDVLSEDQKKSSYEYVLTGTKGEPINKTFIKTGFSSWFVDLPYDYYQAEVKGIPEGYTVDTKEFVVNSKEFQVKFVVIPQEEKPAEKVKVNFEFYYNDKKISPVKFNLDEDYETEYTDGVVELAVGEHALEVYEPEKYIQEDEFSTINVTKDTKNLRIELKEYKEPPKGTLKFEVWELDGTNEKQINTFMTATATTATGGYVSLYNNEESAADYGTYEVKLSPTWNNLSKYDDAKSTVSKTVTLDETHKNVVVKFILVKKGATPGPDPKPNPDGKGTLKVEVYEFSDAGAKLDQFANVMLDGAFKKVKDIKEVSYGAHTVELSSYTWNMYDKYDKDKSIIKKTVTVDANNPNVTVKLYKVIKGTRANPPADTTPTPDPKPQEPTKGTATWDINYTGIKPGRRFFEQVKLYKITDKGDEEVKLGFDQEYNHAEIKLEFGKYAYVLNDFSDYLKVVAKNNRIEFTLDKDHPTFKAVFEIEDKKAVQMVEVIIPKDANETLNDYTFTVFDKDGKEVEGVKKTAKGIEFPATDGADYEIKLDGTKFAYYPNIINAYPSPIRAKYINIVAPLALKVNSLAGDTPVEAKYAVYAKTNYGVTYVTDLKKVPYIGNGNQLYQVKFLSCEQGYKLKDEKVKEITVTQYQRFELTFNFERDTNVAIVNKDELRKLVDEYDKIKATDAYKGAAKALVDAYDSAITEAKAELAKAVTTQEAINALVDKVTKARDAIIGSMENLKKDELKKLLGDEANVKAKDTYKYDTAEDKKAYDDAIINGKKVYADKNATEKDINKAIADIKAALKNLDGFNEADKTELKKLLDEYRNVYNSDKYWKSTEKEREAYQTAIVDGTNIFNKKKATQEEVDAAVKAIEDAIAKLSGDIVPTVKTEKVTLEDAYVNDKYVRGAGTVGAYVYYEILARDKAFGNTESKPRVGMRIGESRKFSIEVGKVREGDEIIVYQKEETKLMSDGVKLNILALDKTELEDLVKKAKGLEDTVKFKHAVAKDQKQLRDELAKAEKVLASPDANREEIQKAETELKLAIAAIENVKIKYFTVTFKYANGAADDEVKVISGDKVLRPEDPKKDGYIFKGWFADEELTKEFDFDKAIEANTNVYAKWEEIIHLVTFNPMNGEATWAERVREGEKVTKPVDPVWANHTFIAWQFNGEDYNFDTSVMSNIKLIAKWEENRVEPTPTPIPTPTPEPYEPYEPYKPEPKPHRPYRPITPRPESKPEEKREEKPVEPRPTEPKKDYGIITEYPINPVDLKDIPAGDAGEAIRNLVSYGIIKGMGNGKFEGGLTINRAMVTRVFMLICKDKAITNDVYFKDVKDSAWYAQSVKWAASKGIIAGYTDGTFKAEKKVSRQEFCVMLMNLLKAHGIELNAVVPVNEADFANVAAWSKDAMIAMKRAGLVNVDASGKFGPESEFTRAELAKTIDMLIKLIKLK